MATAPRPPPSLDRAHRHLRCSIASRPAATIRCISPSTRPAGTSSSPTTPPICSPCCRCRRRQPGALPTLTTVERHARPARDAAARHVRRTTSRSIARAASSTCRARAPTASSPIASTQDAACWSRRRASRPAPAPAPRHIDFHPTQGAGLRHQRARFHDHDLPPGSPERQAHAAADMPARRRPISPATAPAPRSRSIAPAATSTSPTAATTASACSPSIPPRARWRPGSGCRPRAACRASSPSIPAERFLYVANQGGHSIVTYRVGRDGTTVAEPVRVQGRQPGLHRFQPWSSLMSDKTYGFETLSIHAGAAPDPATGARALPIYQTTAYVFEDADHAAALFNLQTVGFIYSRLTNPTNAALETRLATLEGGRGCTVASSGHAAQVLALFPLMTPGRRDRRLLAPLRRLAAADAEHLSEVRLEGRTSSTPTRRTTSSARVDRQDQGLLHREPGQSRRRGQRHRGDRQDRRGRRRAADRRQHAGHALALQADRLRRDPDRPLDHQVPERHRHVDGRRGRRFRQVRLDARAASSRASPAPSPPITG